MQKDLFGALHIAVNLLHERIGVFKPAFVPKALRKKEPHFLPIKIGAFAQNMGLNMQVAIAVKRGILPNVGDGRFGERSQRIAKHPGRIGPHWWNDLI